MKTQLLTLVASVRTRVARALLLSGLACLAVVPVGCTAITSPVNGVPAHRLPPQFMAPPKNNLIPIDASRLRQEPPRHYLVDSGDILGIFIEGVLGNLDEPPPVHMPTIGSDLPPALGYPIPVREDGTMALPLVPAIAVRGLTLTQIESVVRKAYTVDQEILQKGKDRIIVTLMRKRTYNVIVMRQDGTGLQQAVGTLGAPVAGFARSTQGEVVSLPAYENDVLHALAQTGGLPGVDAKNEIKILRSSLLDAQKRDAFIQCFYATPVEPCMCRPPLPDDPAIIRIPLRLPPGVVPTFRPEDIILEDGDLVLIEGREREVFYTGGLLGGGEFPLPRDYDLDVLGAMSIVGGGVAGGGRNPGGGGFGGGMGGSFGGGFGAGSVGGVPPGQLFILRKTPCSGQVIIAVDLNRAIRDPLSRPLIQPGDMLILQYKPVEEILNFGLGTFFTFGIAELLQNNN